MGTWCTEGVKRTAARNIRIEYAERSKDRAIYMAERVKKLEKEKKQLKENLALVIPNPQ